ncbi:NTF2-related export protein 2-like [Ornithodoros turicata]
MAADVVSQKERAEQATKAGEDFAKLFYETLEKRRHLLANLFLENATVLWNGNVFNNKADIGKFYESLPACEAQLICVDSQPIWNEFVQGQTTIHVAAVGQVKYTGKSWTPFTESFVLTAQGTVWKLVVDTFRFQEPVSG